MAWASSAGWLGFSWLHAHIQASETHGPPLQSAAPLHPTYPHFRKALAMLSLLPWERAGRWALCSNRTRAVTASQQPASGLADPLPHLRTLQPASPASWLQVCSAAAFDDGRRRGRPGAPRGPDRIGAESAAQVARLAWAARARMNRGTPWPLFSGL
eukprot:360600-Chlamydomonas_euryale.AAC.8